MQILGASAAAAGIDCECASHAQVQTSSAHERRFQVQLLISGTSAAAAGIACECASHAQVQTSATSCSRPCECPSPSPSADASAAAAGIASARPVAKCRCAEFRRERRFQVQIAPSHAQVQMSATSCSRHCASGRPVAKCRCERCCSRHCRHCECQPHAQVQMCRIQPRALLQQAALRVAVPSPSADFSHEALLQQALQALRVPTPMPSADVQNSAASAAAAGSIASGVPSPSARFQPRGAAAAAHAVQFGPGNGRSSLHNHPRIAGKVLPFASFAVRRSPLARAAKNGQFWPVFGPFSRAAATVASGAKRQPSQHPGTPRVAQGWMGLSYSREGARPSLRSLSAACRSLGRPENGQFWPVFGAVFGAAVGAVSGRLDVGIGVAGEGAAFRFVRRPSLAARSGGQKTASFGLFLGRFRVPRRSWRAVRNVQPSQHPGTPGWHRGGWGFRIAGKVPPVASFALRRSPLASGGTKRPVLALFLGRFSVLRWAR
ncbi:hypothetical protein OPV22_034714 [Ensete ventricosum]|uniref:CRC domain-containing protein n=1 Tax=Ensete ventricosum TaxID=4639 RepID=A0AAV8PUA1_ENSVE|nr:hypothetical protein OPV22_034714 [Ensete ventricosum]